MPMSEKWSSTMNSFSFLPAEIPHNSVLGQQELQLFELQFDQFPTPSSFVYWKIRFKTQVSSCSHFPKDATLWIKEVEMSDSVDDSKSSRSVASKDFRILNRWTRELLMR